MQRETIGNGAKILLTLGFLLAPAMPADANDAPKKLAFEVVDRNAQQMTDVSDALFYFGELGMQEFESTKLLNDTLTAAGFKVELGGAGMPTNLWAEYGSGRPKIAIVTEVDALPGGSQTPGHLRAQAAGRERPRAHGRAQHPRRCRLHGRLRRQGGDATPQHSGNGRDLVRAGRGAAGEPAVSRARRHFKDVDAIILLHIRDTLATGFGVQNYAAISSVFTFHGKTAHGATNPWDGKDAVDAIELMDIGFDKLREHLRPTYRAHRDDHRRRHPAQHHSGQGTDLVVRARRLDAGRQGNLRQAAQDRGRRGADDRHDLGRQIRRLRLAAARQQGDRRGGAEEHRAGRRAAMERAGAAIRQGFPEGGGEAGGRAAHRADPARRAHAGRLVERQRRRHLGGAGWPRELSLVRCPASSITNGKPQ